MKIVASNSITVSNVNDGTITHTAWSYSADGTDRFTTVYPNLNLLDGAKDFSGTWSNSEHWTNDGTYKGLTVKKRTGQWGGIFKTFTAPKDGVYTFSAYIKASGATTTIIRHRIVNGVAQTDYLIGSNFDWRIDTVTVSLKTGQTAFFRYEIYTNNADAILWTAGHKWEQGSIATPHMQSSSEVTTSDWPKYRGEYSDISSEQSTNPSNYTWSPMRGDDGKASVVHWAYSDNADGTGFTTTDNGQRYIGHYSDYTQADSTDKTKYRWADRWAKIDVGGANLIKNGGFPTNTLYWSGAMIVSQHGFYYNGQRKLFLLQTTGTAEITASTNRFEVKRNTDYTLSFYAFAASNVKSSDVYFLGRKSNETNGFTSANAIIASRRFSGSKAEYVTITFNSGDNDNGYIRFDNNGSTDGINALLFFGEVMLAEGSAPQKWSASYDEIAASIDSKADQTLTQEQINALNEKNQILESEMQAKASMEAFSDLEKTYQSFVKSNADGQAKAKADLIEAGRRIKLLTTQFGGLAELKTFIDTYMSSSNEGLVIGKNDASSTIKVSSDRISMFSAGKEVMYISQGVISINNGIFTTSVQIGKFRTEQYHLNADMNVIRYVGG